MDPHARAGGAVTRAPIVALEGPSAVGKTTLAATLACEAGAAVLPEPDASGAPPPAESAEWFLALAARRWAEARALARSASLVVLDGEPFKGLWYNPTFPERGWPGLDALAPRYRDAVSRGAIGFPDLTVMLVASEAALRARRAGDPTRTRRGFEAHLRLVDVLARHAGSLAEAAPGRVLVLDTADRGALAPHVLAAVAALPRDEPDAPAILEALLARLGAAG